MVSRDMADVQVELNQPPINVTSMVPPLPTAMSSGSLSPPPSDSSPETHHVQHYQQPRSNQNLRAPKCTRCRNHGVISDLRGHKHKCFWRDCTCTKCLISSDRQRATADRIALFRQQVRQVTTADQSKRNEKRNYSESGIDDHPTIKKYSQISTGSPRKQPPPFPKVTIAMHENAHYLPPSPLPSPYWSNNNNERNMEVLRQIFPFYDLEALTSISRDNNYDLLKTVLSISAYLLENRPLSKDDVYYSPSPSSPHHTSSFHKMTSLSGRCCSSPYCPVNSYLNLRHKSPEIMQHLPTPPLTAISPPYHQSPYGGDSLYLKQSAAKKFRFSKDENDQLPFCESCKKFGINGDKFCPLCGILFPHY